MAFLIQPKLLLLDEAFVGMDCIYRDNALSYLKWLNETEKTTIVVTSHQVWNLKTLCSRILVLSHGSMVYYGRPQELERNYASLSTITIGLHQQIPDLAGLAVEKYELTNNELKVVYHRNKISAKTILHHILNQCEVGEICIREQDLEQALLLIQGGIRK